MPEINYFWDEIEDNVVREYDENNNTIANYTTEPTLYGSVISQERSGVSRQYHFDGQGNTTELTDESGNVTDSRRYSAFGEVTESTGGTSLSYGFGGAFGYYRDPAAGHIVIRSRPYLPAIARWASHDPLRLLALMDPLDDLNHYTYCSNRPLTYSDPSGLLGRPSVIWRYFFGNSTGPYVYQWINRSCGDWKKYDKWHKVPIEIQCECQQQLEMSFTVELSISATLGVLANAFTEAIEASGQIQVGASLSVTINLQCDLTNTGPPGNRIQIKGGRLRIEFEYRKCRPGYYVVYPGVGLQLPYEYYEGKNALITGNSYIVSDTGDCKC